MTSIRRQPVTDFHSEELQGFTMIHPMLSNGEVATGIASIILYSLATLDIVRQIGGKKPHNKGRFLKLGALALLFHCANLGQMVFSGQGVNLGLFIILSLIGGLITFLAIATSLYRPVENTAIGAFPIAAITVALSLFFAPSHPLQPYLSWGMTIHVLVSILAFGTLAIAALQAIILGWQERQLRRGKLQGLLAFLPPMQTTEQILFEIIGFGVALLTISIATGFIFVDNVFAQHIAHKTLLTICAWFIFSGLLIGRYKLGWRGATAINWTLAGFALLFLAFIGSKAVLELIIQAP